MYIHMYIWLANWSFGNIELQNCYRLVGWHSGQRWHRLWSRLSKSVWWRCTCSFASPECLQIHGSATMVRKASCHVVMMKPSWVSFKVSLHHCMPRGFNTPLHLFLDRGLIFLDQVFRFLYCGPRQPSFGHFGHIQGQLHVGLFQQYPTSLPCHSSRHVENVHEISSCF